MFLGSDFKLELMFLGSGQARIVWSCDLVAVWSMIQNPERADVCGCGRLVVDWSHLIGWLFLLFIGGCEQVIRRVCHWACACTTQYYVELQ